MLAFMSKASKPRASVTRKTVGSAAKAAQTYRGVVLQKPAVKSRFSAKEVDDAIKAAIAKNAHVFAGDS